MSESGRRRHKYIGSNISPSYVVKIWASAKRLREDENLQDFAVSYGFCEAVTKKLEDAGIRLKRVTVKLGHRFFFYSVFFSNFTRLSGRFSKSTRLDVTRFFLISKSTRFCFTRFFDFMKSTRLFFTRFLIFVQKVLGRSLLGFSFFCKK